MEGMHDLADDADYADSQQQVKNNMPHVQSLTKKQEMKEVVKDSGSSSGPDASEVLYLKNNVAIHPTQYALERINGRLRLIKQGSSLFMTWIPYKQCCTSDRLLNSRTSEKDRNLYTIRAVPLAEVKSIRRHAPPFGWQYIIVVLTSGIAFPPLYFHNGGVREFLATLKEHVVLVRSADDANVFIVNDIHDPLQKSLTSLQLQGALPLANSRSSLNGQGVEHSMHLRKESLDDSQHNNHCNEPKETSAHRDRTRDPARDISIHVLERFSRVTKFARDTTAHLFGDNRLSGSMDGFKENSLVEVDSPSDATYATEPGQHDKLKGTESDTLLDAQHTDHRNGNLEVEEATNVGVFEIIDELQYQKMSLVWGKHRLPPLGYDEWSTFFDSEGRVVDSKALRKRVFYGGIEHSIRQEVWKFLLGYYAFDSTYAEREYMSATKRAEYHTLKAQWQTITSSQAKRFSKFRERKSRIEKDVVRTDRSLPYYSGDDNPNVDRLRDILLTYSFYNFDLGYCQGMSDLLSPIMFVMEDESESFWCFTALMERLGPNFDRDQNGMHSQLLALSKLVELLDAPLHNYFKQTECLNYFFCFRWILIQFKREFEYEKVMRLWEVLWTRYLSEHFHLYMCVALLKRFRKKIIEEEMDFDTLLKFINELSYHIDLESTLRDAEALCVCAGEAGLACIPSGTPPSLPNVQEAY